MVGISYLLRYFCPLFAFAGWRSFSRFSKVSCLVDFPKVGTYKYCILIPTVVGTLGSRLSEEQVDHEMKS